MDVELNEERGVVGWLASEPEIRAGDHPAIGNPSERIVTPCRMGRVDLLVVGTQGRSGLACARPESVADARVRSAPWPVSTISPSMERRIGAKKRSDCECE